MIKRQFLSCENVDSSLSYCKVRRNCMKLLKMVFREVQDLNSSVDSLKAHIGKVRLGCTFVEVVSVFCFVSSIYRSRSRVPCRTGELRLRNPPVRSVSSFAPVFYASEAVTFRSLVAVVLAERKRLHLHFSDDRVNACDQGVCWYIVNRSRHVDGRASRISA